MPPQEKRLKFVEGERVLCFHGPLLYEAVIKGQLRDKVTKYLIHYNGWNKNWDEWVTESRVMKYCEENLKKQKELKQQHMLVLLFFLRHLNRPCNSLNCAKAQGKKERGNLILHLQVTQFISSSNHARVKSL